MRDELAAVLGLIDASHPAAACREDFAMPGGAALRAFEGMGFLGEPGLNPVPSCPSCLAGVPYRLGDDYLCGRCGDAVPPEDLLIRRIELEALLRWLAGTIGLAGAVAAVDDGLWRLGTYREGATPTECFYLRGATCSALARRRLLAFRSVLVLHGKPEQPAIAGFGGPFLSLLDVLELRGDTLAARPLRGLLSAGGAVRFDAGRGLLHAGDRLLGRIPPGTREYHLIACLADRLGEAVPYGDLKHYVCGMTGSRDGTDEATFCQKLKSRIKKAYGVAEIDRLLATDRKLGGYRLLSEATLDERGSLVGA